MTHSTDSRAAAAAFTRTELLDAGVRILSRDPARHVFGHLKANLVAAEAGRTTGAFFHHWDTQEQYVDELIAYLFERVPSESFEMLKTHLLDAVGSDARIPDAIVESCRDVVSMVPHEAQTVVEVLLWACAARDSRLTELARAGYDARDPQGDAYFDQFLEMMGRVARPPFTTRSMGIVLSLIGQIVALRAAITPEALPEDTVGWIVLSLLPLLTTAGDDTRTAAEIAYTIAGTTLEVLRPNPAG
jgi:AcrR family transcriptional regulator